MVSIFIVSQLFGIMNMESPTSRSAEAVTDMVPLSLEANCFNK